MAVVGAAFILSFVVAVRAVNPNISYAKANIPGKPTVHRNNTHLRH